MSHVNKFRILMLGPENDHVEAQHNIKKYIVRNIFGFDVILQSVMWPHASYKTWIYPPGFKMVRFLVQSIFKNGSFDELLATSGCCCC